MSLNFQQKVIHSVIGNITSCGKNDGIGKRKEKMETKYRQKTLNDIPLFQLVGVNHHQPILYTIKRMAYIYATGEQIIKFTIGYMINPSIHINKVFI